MSNRALLTTRILGILGRCSTGDCPISHADNRSALVVVRVVQLLPCGRRRRRRRWWRHIQTHSAPHRTTEQHRTAQQICSTRLCIIMWIWCMNALWHRHCVRRCRCLRCVAALLNAIMAYVCVCICVCVRVCVRVRMRGPRLRGEHNSQCVHRCVEAAQVCMCVNLCYLWCNANHVMRVECCGSATRRNRTQAHGRKHHATTTSASVHYIAGQATESALTATGLVFWLRFSVRVVRCSVTTWIRVRIHRPNRGNMPVASSSSSETQSTGGEQGGRNYVLRRIPVFGTAAKIIL